MPGKRKSRSASVDQAGRRVHPRATKKLRRWSALTRRMRRVAKSVVSSTKETMHLDYDWSKTELNHNLYPGFRNQLNTLTAMPTQGTTDSNRLGNDIYRLGYHFRVMFGVKQDRQNTKFRLVLVGMPKGASTLAYANVFDAVTSNVMLDPIDKDRTVRVYYDKIIGYKNLNPGVPTTGKETTFFRKFYVPMRKVIKFYDDGAQDNNDVEDLWLIIMAYDAFGSLIADNIGYVQVWHRLYWKER